MLIEDRRLWLFRVPKAVNDVFTPKGELRKANRDLRARAKAKTAKQRVTGGPSIWRYGPVSKQKASQEDRTLTGKSWN